MSEAVEAFDAEARVRFAIVRETFSTRVNLDREGRAVDHRADQRPVSPAGEPLALRSPIPRERKSISPSTSSSASAFSKSSPRANAGTRDHSA